MTLIQQDDPCSRHCAQHTLTSISNSIHSFVQTGKEAEELEKAFGIPVLRHTEKKPAGGCADMEAHFGCQAHELVMIGDRYLTDVVFGNRHGMLTVRVAPLTRKGEPATVGLARRVEEYYVGR